MGGQALADQDGIGRLGEDVGGQALADQDRTWVDMHWQTRRGRG